LLISKKELKISVIGGFLEILSLQFPGKKRMNTAELLNGMMISSAAKAL
jgi:methionyl-tRNA formyltransferase